MRKTGLLNHVFSQLDAMGMVDTIYLDIYYTESLQGFINKLGTAALREKESLPAKVRKMIKQFIGSMRPTIPFDSLTGAPTQRGIPRSVHKLPCMDGR